jgi:hypothetical protein
MKANVFNLAVVRDEEGNLRIIVDASFPSESVLVLNDADARYLVAQLQRKTQNTDNGRDLSLRLIEQGLADAENALIRGAENPAAYDCVTAARASLLRYIKAGAQ